jgi:hypothetical protein
MRWDRPVVLGRQPLQVGGEDRRVDIGQGGGIRLARVWMKQALRQLCHDSLRA